MGRLSIVTFVLLALALPSGAAPTFKVYVQDSGVYQITYEMLEAAGLPGHAWPSERIGLRRAGEGVPLLVNDGDDGSFGPGDSLVFVGEMLAGEYSFLDEYSSYNCYFLSFDDESGRRFTTLVAAEGSAQARQGATLEARYHLEEDRLILRFHQQPDQPQEIWYWAKLVHLDKQPFRQALDLEALERRPGAVVRITVNLKGWSNFSKKPNPSLPDHHVDISVNDTPVGYGEWNGQDAHTVEVEVPTEQLEGERMVVALRAPKRMDSVSNETVIDVSMLNWIEVAYPRSATVESGQAIVYLENEPSEPAVIRSPPGTTLSCFTSEGLHLVAPPSEPNRAAVDPARAGERLFVTTTDELSGPPEIVLDRPSNLRSTANQADYIMIAHRSLLEAIEPLAACHRRRGLNVTVVDVQDVYDEFNHGIIHPRSIKDFLRHAYHHWRRPAPRWVLLVGDASWDYKNQTTDDNAYADWTFRPHERLRFGKNTSTPYSENADLNHRLLVPTWNYATYEGHAASDNWFVCVDGDDASPDMAIGRFAAASGPELAGMVSKTVSHIESPEVGPWRRNVVFVTNESTAFQRASDRLAEGLMERGYAAAKIYPRSSETSNEGNTRRIVEALDRGAQVVHFLGHGGRYIWRTGPPDLKKNHDLFTLDDLDTLEPNRQLPVVLSLTCYSAPFDHPIADSIGEKLLRLPDRGAIAVFAASWRNSPSPEMGRLVLAELTQPGTTIGEAIQRAKAGLRNAMLVQTYNLLGDPAVPVAAPGLQVRLEETTSPQRWTAHGTVDLDGFEGQAIVEWLGPGFEVLHRVVLDVDASELSAELDPASLKPGAELRGIRAYLWNEAAGQDAIGWIEHRPEEQAAEAGR